MAEVVTNGVSLLQTQLGHREGHEARRMGLEALPLDQHIKHRHGASEACLEVLPAPVHDFLAVADHGQHREHGLHQQAVLPRAALTQCEVGRIPLGGMEGRITQDNHAFFKLSNEPLKGVIRDVRGGTRPPHHQPPLMQQETQFPADNPAGIREPFATDFCWGLRPSRMGWINSMPYVSMTPSTVGAAQKACVQS